MYSLMVFPLNKQSWNGCQIYLLNLVGHNFFKLLKNRTKYMPEADKDVVLIMDKWNLRKGLEHDSRNGRFVGFHRHDDLSLQKVANHALLIWRKGLKSNRKLPVAHLFSSGVTPTEDLANIVKTNTIKLFQVGLRVRAPVCD